MIPLSSTTVTVAAATEPEPGEGRTFTTRATGVRAVIGAPGGTETYAPGGGVGDLVSHLTCDPVSGMARTDRVTDEVTGFVYEVVWVVHRSGLGVDHVEAELRHIDGAV